MTEHGGRAAAKRDRLIQRKLETLLARPGAEEELTAIMDRVINDPDHARKIGPKLVRAFRHIDRVSTIRADAGKTGGIAAGRSMTAQERITRAHKGGVAAFYRGGNASTYGKYLVDRREKKRRRSRLKLLN